VIRLAILPRGVEGLAEITGERRFIYVELEAMEDRPPEHREALADTGAFVVGARLSGALHVDDIGQRREALARMRRQVEDAARLGAWMVYLAPGAVTGAAAREVGHPKVGLALEGDDENQARELGNRLWYVRRPGKSVEDYLAVSSYPGFVAVSLADYKARPDDPLLPHLTLPGPTITAAGLARLRPPRRARLADRLEEQQ
jgi:sugar phosphate isomerase/epimerase